MATYNRDWTKMSLQEMLSLGIWKKVDPPRKVYHMTDRSNLDSIMKDGAIKTGHDYICWFFIDPTDIPTYIDFTGALHGRKFFDYDGKEHTAPPLIPSETIVLELIPRYIEPQAWYMEQNTIPDDREIIDADTGNALTEEARAEVIEKYKAFDRLRIAHYGAMKFKQAYKVIELTDILPAELNHEAEGSE